MTNKLHMTITRDIALHIIIRDDIMHCKTNRILNFALRVWHRKRKTFV